MHSNWIRYPFWTFTPRTSEAVSRSAVILSWGFFERFSEEMVLRRGFPELPFVGNEAAFLPLPTAFSTLSCVSSTAADVALQSFTELRRLGLALPSRHHYKL